MDIPRVITTVLAISTALACAPSRDQPPVDAGRTSDAGTVSRDAAAPRRDAGDDPRDPDGGHVDVDASPPDPIEQCTGGADEDGDGRIDCADEDCGTDEACEEAPDLVADWETGDWSQWDGPLGRDPDAQIDVVTDVVRQGRYAARFQVRPGDRYRTTSGERAEVHLWDYRREREGDTFYYAWSTLFPEGWRAPERWGIVMQWHAHTDISPPMAFNAGADRLDLVFSSGNIDSWWPAEYEESHRVLDGLSPGRWHDFIVRIDFRADTSGSVEVWHRLEGTAEFDSVLAVRDVPTLQWSTDSGRIHDGYAQRWGEGWVSGVWVQHGLYRSASSATDVIYHDGFCRGTSYAAVRGCFDE
ncbi:polysaccharide lyase [Sandaracinus amylolyticus]|uniref:polysaccharide lyase n=1 Tax=Sandaracinus amylolyticus TaxID=927083 RepID=UPI001F1E2AF1|nr:polysaccharide lyase [Sandaracinus amylolyticus]UJR80049.1 Hypothetical protein I5071_20930 [Sandaracinus amylolyticus]